MKLKSSKGIAFHVVIHLIVTALLIKEPFGLLPLLIILGITHFLIDWLKLRYPTESQVPGFLLDQLLHLIVLGFLAAVFTTVQPVLPDRALTIALVYALIPPIIMVLWLLAIDMSRIKNERTPCLRWSLKNLLPISQTMGLPLLLVLGVGIFL